MIRILFYIIFLGINFQLFSFNSKDFVNNAVEQIDYLYNRNNNLKGSEEESKQWYVYFLNKDKSQLENYLIGNTSIKSFSTSYLEHLNDILIEINATQDVAMYVAVSDYDQPITLPITPRGNSIEEKIEALRNSIDPNNISASFPKVEFDPDDVKKGIKDYEIYRDFFYAKADEIFENSVLSKISDERRVLMPFSVYHYVNLHNRRAKYYTFIVKSSSLDKEADETAKGLRSVYDNLQGKTVDEKKLETVALSYLDYYSGNTGVPITSYDYKKEISSDSELYKRALGQEGYTPDLTFDLSNHLLDFSGVLSQQEKENIFKEVDFSRELFKGMKMYVILTDHETSSGLLNEVKNLTPNESQYVLWLHIDNEGYLNFNNITPNGFDEQIANAISHWTEKMWANLALNYGEGTVAHLRANLAVSHKLLSYASEILAYGIVPEKYWNPRDPEYSEYMLYIASAFNATMGDLDIVFNEQKAQLQFAFKTGVWNGVVDEVKGLADAGKMATEYFLNPDKAKEFDQGLDQLTISTVWNSFKQAHGFEEGKETNEFRLSHQLGKDVVFAASFFIGVGEVTALAKTGKLAKVSTLANNVSKVSRVISNGVLKVLKKMPPNIAKSLKKLPTNIIKEAQKIGVKSYLILKINTTKLAKISDEAVFSEMKILQDGAVVKLTDGADAIFENVRYFNDIGENTGNIAIVKSGDEVGVKIGNTGDDLATLLAKYKNVRKYLDDGQIKAYLNATDANKFTDLLSKGHPDVLKHMDEMDVDDFGEMIRGYIDNPNAFKNSLADLDKFNGKYGWLTYWKVTPDIKKSFKTLREDLKGKDLLPTGDATEIELATLHAFTVKGDFLNIPLRYNKSYLGAYADKGIKHVKSALDNLRKVSSRKYVGDVFSGKTFSKADFEKTFVGGKGKEVAFDGFVSSSVKEPVAEGFIVLSKQWVSSAEKVAVIRRIKSKSGVYIDDLSDWGKYLGNTRHADFNPASVRVQDEVLMNEGYFKQVSEPIKAMQNGVQKTIDGIPVYYVDFVELLKPLN